LRVVEGCSASRSPSATCYPAARGHTSDAPRVRPGGRERLIQNQGGSVIINTSYLAVLGFAYLCIAPTASKAQDGVPLDAAQIERDTGAKGQFSDDKSVFKVSVPRSDLAVTADGIHLTPPMGLTAWASFMRSGATSMVMGDMVLLEDQVNAAMSAALDHGLEVTALHN